MPLGTIAPCNAGGDHRSRYRSEYYAVPGGFFTCQKTRPGNIYEPVQFYSADSHLGSSLDKRCSQWGIEQFPLRMAVIRCAPLIARSPSPPDGWKIELANSVPAPTTPRELNGARPFTSRSWPFRNAGCGLRTLPRPRPSRRTSRSDFGTPQPLLNLSLAHTRLHIYQWLIMKSTRGA
jgi:hypothetical protein